MLDNIATGTIVIEDLEVGMFREASHFVSEQDVEDFATSATCKMQLLYPQNNFVFIKEKFISLAYI